MCFIHKIEHDSEIKQDKLLIGATIWMNLKCILLGEIRQMYRIHISWFDLCDILQKQKTMGPENRSLLPVVGEERLTKKGLYKTF